MLASLLWVAGVQGTKVPVVTGLWLSNTYTVLAMIRLGTWVTIITGRIYRCINATGFRFTVIPGTGIVIIAVYRVSHAFMFRITYLGLCAFIMVIAGTVPPWVQTSTHRFITDIRCTWVIIITGIGFTFTQAIFTLVIYCAEMPVITGCPVIHIFMKNPGFGVTAIQGALITIVCLNHGAYALSVFTMVTCGTYRIIIT